jgi:uncharacterized membrane protein
MVFICRGKKFLDLVDGSALPSTIVIRQDKKFQRGFHWNDFSFELIVF